MASGEKPGIEQVQPSRRWYGKASSPSSAPQAADANTSIQILTLVLIAFAVYLNSLFGGFVYDDALQIVGNPWIRSFRFIPAVFSSSVWGFQSGAFISNYYRPLMHVANMLIYYSFGLNALGFHLVNVVFHCGTSALVFLLIRRLLAEREAPPYSGYLSPPFIAAALFALHPIHTEAVAWIAGLPDVAFTFFYLLSFYCYIRSKAMLSACYLISIAGFAASALFKEPALTLPLMLVAYDYAYRDGQARIADHAKKYAPYLMAAAGYLALRMHALGDFSPMKVHADLSAYQQAINIFPLFAGYLVKLVIPLDLNVYHVLHPISSLIELRGALSLAVTLGFAASMYAALKRNRPAFFAMALIVVPLIPVFYISALGENTFAERYLYLPSVGYVLLLAILITSLRHSLPSAARGVTIALLSVSTLFAIATIERNKVWRDDLSLWSDTVSKSPDSADAHNALGVAYASNGQADRAMEQYQRAIQLRPGYAIAHDNMGSVYKAQGGLDQALAEYRAALRINPNAVDTHTNIGYVYAAQGLWDEAAAEFKAALRLNPDSADAHNALGSAYKYQGKLDLAVAEFQTVVRLNPDSAVAHNNLGAAYKAQGRLELAAEELKTALRLKPDYLKARQSLDEIVSMKR